MALSAASAATFGAGLGKVFAIRTLGGSTFAFEKCCLLVEAHQFASRLGDFGLRSCDLCAAGERRFRFDREGVGDQQNAGDNK